MERTGWLAVVAVLAVGVGGFVRWQGPTKRPALPCASSEIRRDWVDGASVARCMPADAGEPLSSKWAQAVGQQLDLNQIDEAALAQVPGVGAKLAHAVVETRVRLAGFRDWDQVDAVAGVGPAKLATLQARMRIGQ